MSWTDKLEKIVSHLFPGWGCRQLVKQTQQQITVTGLNVGITGYTITLGGVSNQVIKLYEVDKIMQAMDGQQITLCQTINQTTNPDLKDEFIKMRVQTILAFSQFEAFSQDPVGNRDAIAKWADTMNTLMKLNMEALSPSKTPRTEKLYLKALGGPKKIPDAIPFKDLAPVTKGPVDPQSVSDVQKYLGIDEDDLKKAVSEIKSKKAVIKKKNK